MTNVTVRANSSASWRMDLMVRAGGSRSKDGLELDRTSIALPENLIDIS